MARTYTLGGVWGAVPGYGDNGEVAIFNSETRAGFNEFDEWIWQVPEEVLKSIISQIPVGRLGKGEEIADMVAFLAGEQAGYVTGSTLSLNGGQYMAG